MKTFSQLKQRIFESGEHTTGGGFGDRGAPLGGVVSAIKDYGTGNFDLHLDDNLNRVNAFLGAFFQREFVDVNPEMGVLKTKLNMLGLDFDYAVNSSVAERLGTLKEGPNVYEVKRFGGTFGKDVSTPHDEFETTDGFPGGISYKLHMNLDLGENGLYRVNAKIMRQADANDGVSEA